MERSVSAYAAMSATDILGGIATKLGPMDDVIENQKSLLITCQNIANDLQASAEAKRNLASGVPSGLPSLAYMIHTVPNKVKYFNMLKEHVDCYKDLADMLRGELNSNSRNLCDPDFLGRVVKLQQKTDQLQAHLNSAIGETGRLYGTADALSRQLHGKITKC